MMAETFISLIGLLSLSTAQLPTSSATAIGWHELPTAKSLSLSPRAPVKLHPEAQGVDVTARAAVVMDVASGQVIFAKDMNTVYPIASLTKLVTAMTYLDQKPNQDKWLTVLPEDQGEEGRMVFPNDEQLTARDLFHALLIGSVNAAGNVLARSTGDRDIFVRAMNAKARQLQMLQATFVDPTGLRSKNRASARDVAMALRAALQYPEIRDTTEHAFVDVAGHRAAASYHIKSTNLLLSSFLNKPPYHIIAAKTGSLPEAGFCLAQVTKNADGREIIVVVLGSDNHFARFQDAKALTAWTFENFAWPN